jgi:hypothetical protein
MSEIKLHPSVEEFKRFVKNHPEIIKAVRAEEVTWQELFEDWYLFGEEDPRWDSFGVSTKKNDESKQSDEVEEKSDWMGQVIGMVKNMDPQQIEGYIYNLSQALGAIQGVLSQFKGNNPVNQQPPVNHPPHPFSFRKD